MITTLIFAIVLTFQWDGDCSGKIYSLVQGVPVPANQPKAEVSLRVVKSNVDGCSTTLDVSTGSYVTAIWGGQSPTTGLMQESNRCSLVVYSDNTWSTDCAAPAPPPGPKAPTNFRFP